MDMLVKLYDLPDEAAMFATTQTEDVAIRRPMAYEKDKLLSFVDQTFGQSARGWRSECDVAFARSPITCHIAIEQHQIIAFACHDVTAKGVFGPIGVAEDWRGQGVGKALLIQVLAAMRADGYAYAVVGHVGAAAFFENSVGAVAIPGSTPGIYPTRLA